MLLLTLVSFIFSFVPFAAIGFLVVMIWSSIDGFLIPGMVREAG